MPDGDRLLTIALAGYIASVVAIALSYAWSAFIILGVLFAAIDAALALVGVLRRLGGEHRGAEGGCEAALAWLCTGSHQRNGRCICWAGSATG